MGENIGKSRRRTTGIVAVMIAAVLSFCLLTPALSPAKPPAVDEYTLDFPHPGGGQPQGTPDSNPAALAPAVRAQLSDPADGPLVAIATDPALGAVPSPAGKGGPGATDSGQVGSPQSGPGDGRGVLAAATGALGEGALPLLGLGLLSVVALAGFAARRRGSAG